MRRAHLQAAIWRSALEADPPVLNPAHYGWSISTHTSKYQLPYQLCVRLPVPESVLKMIKCGCSSTQPCATARCSCSTAHISCSIFCACSGDKECRNPQTLTVVTADEYDEVEDDDSGVAVEIVYKQRQRQCSCIGFVQKQYILFYKVDYLFVLLISLLNVILL